MDGVDLWMIQRQLKDNELCPMRERRHPTERKSVVIEYTYIAPSHLGTGAWNAWQIERKFGMRNGSVSLEGGGETHMIVRPPECVTKLELDWRGA